MKIIDDFLPEPSFKLVERFLMSSDVPWYYNDDIAGGDKGLDGYQLVHKFFDISSPFDCKSCKFGKFIGPVMAKLSPKHLLRAKGNLRPRTSEHVLSNFHTDMKVNQKTGILYINSNDGYTLFKDGTKVKSQRNRFLVFDGHTEHAGTSCTDERVRVVLNMNYIPTQLNEKSDTYT